MLRRGISNVQRLLKQQNIVEEGLLADRLQSCHQAGPNPCSVPTLSRVFSSAGASQVGRSHLGALPLYPSHFQKVLGKDEGLASSLLRRLFSTNSPKRGFENFSPRSHNAPKPTSKASERRTPESDGNGGGRDNNGNNQQYTFNASFNYIALGLLALYLWNASGNSANGARTHEISFQEFKTKLLAQGLVTRLEVANNNTVKVYVKPDSALEVTGPTNGVFRYYFQIGSVDSFERKLDDAQLELGMSSADMVPVKYVQEVNVLSLVVDIMPTLLIMGATYWLISRQMRQMTGGLGGRMGMGGKNGKSGGGPGGFFGMVRANVSTLDKAAKEKMTFKDVAGCDEAKIEIMEFVDFLKQPSKYRDLGAKIPKGALLVGPPGTGKTLLAKATAGEANVPFLSISGSDFMEMFVGVGPARVRDLFAQARAQSPSIIFIDEVDSLCSARGDNESEAARRIKTQLMVEMQGVGSNNSRVLVLAATNLPYNLDQAIRRRFDKRIYIPLPEEPARAQMFKIHLGDTPNTLTDADYQELGRRTEQFSGSDVSVVVKDVLMQPIRMLREATHFKQVKAPDGAMVWEACAPSDPGAKELSLQYFAENDLADKVNPPRITMRDFEKVLLRARPTVSKSDLDVFERFTAEFGEEAN
mmetsp:Transcript_27205/g.59429  ORF Transcript_27205/g.59429 Transcript_27205/m.59429 type:complete len:643 (+) Transcript_27205:135-2063(+)